MTGQTSRISTTAAGAQANTPSIAGQIEDGKKVLFRSSATNLISDDGSRIALRSYASDLGASPHA